MKVFNLYRNLQFLLPTSILIYVAPLQAQVAFQQAATSDGIVSMEAENFDATVAQGGHTFEFSTIHSGYSGTGGIISSPNNGTRRDSDYITNGPRLDFEVNFIKIGTHYVWLRMNAGGSSSDNSFHAGLDGQATTSSEHITTGGSTWKWNKTLMGGGEATIEVNSTGLHTFNIWMREDGASIDKIVLTTNASYIPSGVGPLESPRTSAPLNTPPSVSLTSPLHGSLYTEGLDIVLNADATDTDGTVSKVEFFLGATKLGEDLIAPYSYTWLGGAPGVHSFTAKATDNLGGESISPPANSIIGQSARYEAEDYFQVVTDADGDIRAKTCGSSGILSQDQRVDILDIGDKIKIGFAVATGGNYLINARVRSGNDNSTNSYFSNGYYFEINGNPLPLVGDDSTISAAVNCNGTSYWGLMRSQPLGLNSGYNEVTIESIRLSSMVDYLEITKANNFDSLLAPLSLNAVATSVSQIDLSWMDNAATEDHYIVESSSSPGSGFTVLVTLPSNTTSYSHTGLLEGQKVYYRVKAVSAVAESAYSQAVLGCTLFNDPLVLYDFTAGSGSTVYDRSGRSPVQHLEIVNPGHVSWIPGGGLQVQTPTLIASSGPAEKLNSLLKAVGVLSLEAWVVPENLTQTGPARILTLSGNSSLRNFTLGQSADEYRLRLRAPETNDNGWPEISSGPIAGTGLQHLVITHDRGQLKIYVDSVLVHTAAMQSGYSSWDSTFRFALADEITRNRSWLGTFYQVAVYGRSLSPTEVQDHYLNSPVNDLTAPLSFAAFAVSESQIDLIWTDNTAIEDNYVIEYSATEGTGYSILATLLADDTTYTHTGLNSGETFYYRLKATNAFGASSYVATQSTTQMAAPIALYTFTAGSGATVADQSGIAPAMDLEISNTTNTEWILDGGIRVNTASLMATPGPATKLNEMLGSSNALTIEAWVKPENLHHTGPACMVSLSANSESGNFTLGQELDQYAVRLRTTNTSLNGTPQALSGINTATVNLQHVVFTHASDTLKVYVDGALAYSEGRSGNYGNWEKNYRFGLADELSGGRPWLGDFYRVAVYNQALGEAEVLNNYHGGYAPVNGNVPDSVEIQALRDLYESTNGAHWTNNTGWPTSTTAWDAITSLDQVTGWYGVTTSNGDVTWLQLDHNNLSGTLPISISNLLQLYRLNLGYNSITGTIPVEIGQLTGLGIVNLAGNQLSGPIPASIGSLVGLISLALNNNSLTGTIPDEIGNLTALETLELSANQLGNYIPPSMVNLSLLRSLGLAGLQTTSSLPSFLGDLINLENLNLSNSNFQGSIPAQLNNLVNLTSISLCCNQLSGPLPDLANLVNLETFHLSDNALTGDVPIFLLGFDSLSSISLSNNFLTGFPDFNIHTNPSQIDVNIQNNYIPPSDIDANIVGGIPIFNTFIYDPQTVPPGQGQVLDITEIAALRSLYESTHGANWTNNTGWPSTPAQWDAITSLDQVVGWRGVTISGGDITQLDCYWNNLVGSLAPSIGDLSALEYLYIDDNQLTDLPEEIGNLSKLKYLMAGGNQFTVCPSSIGNLLDLELLYLGRNNFTEVPPEIGNLSLLVELSLGVLPITTLPTSIGNLSNLKYLHLEMSNLTSLPDEMGNLTNLRDLSIHDNQLTSLPETIGNLSNLLSLSVSNNNLTNLSFASGFANPGVLTFDVEGNYLGFGDLEQFFTGVSQPIFSELSYSPQKHPTEVIILEYPVNTSFIITNDRGEGSYTNYQWQEWNGSAWINIAGATSQDLTLPNPDASYAGKKYRCEMINTRVTWLTLYSSEFLLQAVDELPPDTYEATGLYNGTITAMAWRTDEVFTVDNSESPGMYLFGYDDKYQLTEAVFARPDFNLNRYTIAGNQNRVTNLAYDANGNIQGLTRYGDDGKRKHNFAYHYDNGDNQLTAVDGHAQYHYNQVGQLVEELREEGQNKYVEYDVTGKAIAVYSEGQYDPNTGLVNFNPDSLKVSFQYDDRGFRLKKKNHETGLETWYIRDASGNIMSIYEKQEGSMVYVQQEVPVYGSGRLGTYYPRDAGTTAYELTDHLGNVRAVLKNQVSVFTATLEDNGEASFTNPRVEELAFFQNIGETAIQNVEPGLNHTAPDVAEPSPDAASYLNGTTGKTIGPAIGLKVSPGDHIDMKVFGKYRIPGTGGHGQLALADIVTALTGTFTGVNGLESAGQVSTMFNSAFSALSPYGNDLIPGAYLQYILFDTDFNMISHGFGFDQIASTAEFTGPEATGVNFDELALSVDVQDAGYVYIYVSNESPGSEVWFDDLTITHNGVVNTQSTDYYPFGMVMRRNNAPNAHYESEYPGSSMQNSLVAQYTFDGNADDASGNGLNGTVSGATLTTDKDGNANGAYSMDGLDDHIQVPNSASPTSFIQNTGIFTISAWIKLDDLNKRAAIVSTSGTRVYKGFGLMYETFGQGFGDHQLRFSTTDGSNHYFQSLGASNTINDLNWHHVLVTGDGQEIRFYVDGMPDGTPTPITRFSTGDTDKPMLIGTFIGVDDNRHAHLGGSIDDLMIFDRTLTQAEISQLAQKKTPEEIDQNTSNRQQLAFGQYYRWGFQGQFAEEDEETGWNAFELRMYDPVIGRWLVPDPYNEFWSPYLVFGNDPINTTDPDGGCTDGNCPESDLPSPGFVQMAAAGFNYRSAKAGRNIGSPSNFNLPNSPSNWIDYAGFQVGVQSLWVGATDLATTMFVASRNLNLMNSVRSFNLHSSFMDLTDEFPTLANRFFSGTNTVRLQRIGQLGGKLIFGAGIGLSIYNVIANSNGNSNVIGQEMLNTTFSIMGLATGPIGWFSAGAYFITSNTLGTPQNISRMQNNVQQGMKNRTIKRVHGHGPPRPRGPKPRN